MIILMTAQQFSSYNDTILSDVSAIVSMGSTTTQAYRVDGTPIITGIKYSFDCSRLGTSTFIRESDETNLGNFMIYLTKVLPQNTFIVIGNSAGYFPDGGKKDESERKKPFFYPHELAGNPVMDTMTSIISDDTDMLMSDGRCRFILLNRNYKSSNPGTTQTVGQWANVVDEIFYMMDIAPVDGGFNHIFDVGGSGAVCYQFNPETFEFQENREIDLGLSKKNGTSPNQLLKSDPSGKTLSELLVRNIKALFDANSIEPDKFCFVCTGKIRELNVELQVPCPVFILDQNLECYGEAVDFYRKFNPLGHGLVNMTLEDNGKILISEKEISTWNEFCRVLKRLSPW